MSKNQTYCLLMLLLALFQSDKISADLLVTALTGDEAVLVAERYTGKGKILGTTQVVSDTGLTIYRVKILMPSGVLRTVVVDAETGGVLE